MKMHICPVCNKNYSSKSSLNRHKKTIHDGNAEIFKCNQEKCDYTTKHKTSLKRHLWRRHSIGDGKLWSCGQDGCDYKCKQKGNLKQHLWQVHDIGNGKWWSCDQDGCDYKCKVKGNIKQHLWHTHSKGNRKLYKCTEDHCKYIGKSKKLLEVHLWQVHSIGNGKYYKCEHCKNKKFKSNSSLTAHLWQVHDIGDRKYYICEHCDKKFKTNTILKQHLWQVHDIGEGEIYRCGENNCEYQCKANSDFKRHLWLKHSIGKGKIYKCNQEGCEFETKQASNLKQHIQYVHDIGDKTCRYCLGKRFKLLSYKDKNTEKVEICRRCYKKVTGLSSRAEEQMIRTLETSKLKSYIILKDRIVAHDACKTRRRPDVLLSSHQLFIIGECDEKQHKYYEPECEWGRMDEIIDEFKTGKIVFIRWNPDNYTPPEGIPRKNRKERLKMFLELNVEIARNPPPDPITVYYMFYDEDNPVIAKRWKTHFVY